MCRFCHHRRRVDSQARVGGAWPVFLIARLEQPCVVAARAPKRAQRSQLGGHIESFGLTEQRGDVNQVWPEPNAQRLSEPRDEGGRLSLVRPSDEKDWPA